MLNNLGFQTSFVVEGTAGGNAGDGVVEGTSGENAGDSVWGYCAMDG